MRRFKSNLLRIIISLLLGNATGAFFSFRIPTYWEMGRNLRLEIILISGLLLSGIFFWIFHFTIDTFKSNSSEENKLLLFIPYVISIALGMFVMMGSPAHVPGYWLDGWGIRLEYLLNLILILIVLPLCLNFVLNCLLSIKRKLFPNKKPSYVKPFYQRTFCIIFLVLLITPTILSVPQFEEFNTDFWGSDQLKNNFSLIRFYLGDKLFQKSIISKDGWLVYANDVSINDYQNTSPFSESQISNIRNRLSSMNEYLLEKEIKFIIIIPPNKNTIYPEYMPDDIPVIGNISRYDQMKEILSEFNNIIFIDSREILLNAKDDTQVYYATDTHWNPHGAFFAYETIMEEINKDYPDILPYALSDYEIIMTPNRNGDIAKNMLKINMQEDFYELVNKSGINYDYLEISTTYKKYILPNSEAPKLLMFHDSFGNELAPFLGSHFSQTVLIPHDSFNLSYIESELPDIVIFEWTERTFYDYLMRLPD